MAKFLLLITLLISVVYTDLKAQSYPTEYFMAPLKGTLQLSGSFAELRRNHFHSGIDIRTGGKEGLPVYACAEGYVVRIKIEPGGFGKAVYINHPNGFTTVYAHLQKFNAAIDNWIRARQYEKESFAVDLFPPKGLLKVSKGEIIAISGNSGSSEGPHLHFEIRDTKTEMPIDPVLFGIQVKDFIRPTLHGLRIYPEGMNSTINDKATPVTLSLAGWGPVYRLKIFDTIYIAGRFSLGVSASDLMNETSNRNGVTEYAVFIDSLRVFEWKAQKFSFAETRYINSFIDYPNYYNSNVKFMRTHTDPGNKLNMYIYNPSKGDFTAVPGMLHHIKITIKDSHLNESVLRFYVKGVKPQSKVSDKTTGGIKTEGLLFTVNQTNNFATPDMRISLPGNCLYDSIRFIYGKSPSLSNSYSSIHSIHTPMVPLHQYYDLNIRVKSDVKVDTTKLVVVRLNNANKPSSVGGKFENGFMKVKLRDFGKYTVMADTIPPIIRAQNFKEGMDVSTTNVIRITITDNLSGISTYRGEINGKWILLDYDAKNRMLTYRKDAIMEKGVNLLTLTVGDGVGNMAISQWNLRN